MTFSNGNISRGGKPENKLSFELNRFCTKKDYRVIGIASKLLTYFKRNYIWEEIYSYADLRWSDGSLYYKLGFSKISQSNPNYFYVKETTRIYRYSLRKRIDEPVDIPEWRLRLDEGFYRIWDCGSLKFSLKNVK
jgi:hypothetical protein